MLVKFIAHAGIYVKEGDISILIDPWFTDSTLGEPFVEGLSGAKTIDFQIPKTIETADKYAPDAILLSHFHAHHSPRRDIQALIEKNPTLTMAYPNSKLHEDIAEKLSPFKQLTILPVNDREDFSVGRASSSRELKITGLTHTNKGHLAWLIEGSKGKILHISDPRKLNSQKDAELSDETWRKFRDLKPDILFISAGGNSLRKIDKLTNERTIREAELLTPIQGAELTKMIKPKAVSLIGIYNHSIWKNRDEYIPEGVAVEKEFHWAISWLDSSIKFIRVFPGHLFGIKENDFATQVDTFIV